VSRTGHRAYRRAREKLKQNPVCFLCGGVIDLTLTVWVNPKTGKTAPHPMSFSAHHVIPYDQGGTNKDMVPAHLICNMRQGDSLQAKTTRHSRAWR
jgi:hypothetical protein